MRRYRANKGGDDMGRGKSKASAKELTLDEKVAANREALKKAQDEFYKLPSDADDETFKRVNGKLNQLQEEQYNLEKEQKKAERERKKAEKAVKTAEPTKAKFVENMNEAQIDIEISKAQQALTKAKADRAKYGGLSAEESALREAFPLGTGGLNRRSANRTAARLSESALSRGLKLESAIKAQTEAERKLKELQTAKKRVKGTGKTLKELVNKR